MKRPIVLPGPVLVRVVELFEVEPFEEPLEPELVEPVLVLVDGGVVVVDGVGVVVLTCDCVLVELVLGVLEGFEPAATGVFFEPPFLLLPVLACLPVVVLSEVCVVLSAVLIW
jgi:hypothetical protein